MRGLRGAFAQTLDLLAPLCCPVCGRRLVGRASCPHCRLPDAGLALRELRADRWGPCLVLSGGAFSGDLRRIVHAFKYRQDPAALNLLAAQTASALPAGLRWDALVPVPSHPVRVRERGGEPVQELARRLGELCDLPVRRVLRRRRYTRTLAGMSRLARRREVQRAFSAQGASGCLLLVDDVSTSGATLQACRRALLEAGARGADQLAAARTLRRVETVIERAAGLW